MLKCLLLILVFSSWAYWLIAWRAVAAFFRTRMPAADGYRPSVSILRPLKGADAHAYDNFATLCRQDYSGDIELLFGVADQDDPAIEIIHRLQRDFPNHQIRLIVAPSDFANPKVGNLHHLAQQARHDLLVLSDGDIRVGPEYLTRVVAPLSDSSVGVVTCPYCAALPENIVAHLEALDIETQFFPSTVIASRLLGMRMGLGATIAIRRSDLPRIGGFPAIADYLADDFQLAERIADLGLKTYLSDYVVASVMGKMRFSDHWKREVRWMRGVRVSAPGRYPGVILTFSTPLAALLLFFPHFFLPAAGALLISMLIRWFVAWRIRCFLGLSKRRGDLVLLPLRDFLTAAVFFTAAVGTRVSWRGNQFKVQRDGRLQRISPIKRRGIFRRGVIALDTILRRLQGIYEYSNHADCAFRISVIRSGQNVTLSNSLHVTPDDTVGELHLWNDHLPPIPSHGADLDWAVRFGHQLTHSMQDLARHAKSDPRFANVKAIHGRASSITPRGIRQLERLADHFGFELIPVHRTSRFARLHDRAEDLLIWLLNWSFNPASHKGKIGQIRQRRDFWMTMDTLRRQYASPAPVGATLVSPSSSPTNEPQCSH